MVTKLVQKHPFKGTQVFEIVEDEIRVQIKAPFRKEETLTVMMTVLNSEPVISKSRLEFTSRVNNEALLSLFLAKPNADEFNAFVSHLKQKIADEFNAFAGLKPAMSSELERNVFEEPPEFDDTDDTIMASGNKPVDVEQVEESIRLLSDHIGNDEIKPFLSALESLQAEPQNEAHLATVLKEFQSLGANQGAVLTYAPYIISLLSDDPYGSGF